MASSSSADVSCRISSSSSTLPSSTSPPAPPPTRDSALSRPLPTAVMPPRNIDVDALPPPATPPSSPGDAAFNGEVAPVVTEATHAQKRPPTQIVWVNVVYYGILHLAALYGLILLPFLDVRTWLWTFLVYLVGALGITAGAHRLWAHRSYKAKTPARILLAIFNCVAFQNDIIEWSRDHRLHHKYSETDADPHNANRGFFFAHMGWLLVRKHPDVKVKGRELNYDDLYRDPVLVAQRKLYLPAVALLCFGLPTWVPHHYWGEDAWAAFFTCGVLRYALSLNITWLVNSAAHMWGNRPYDRHINPAENIFVTFGAVGEGYHNYHHTFPSDYSTSEYGWKLNLTTLFIDFLAYFGQVSDRKKMSRDAVFRRSMRTGDGSRGFGHLKARVDKTTEVKTSLPGEEDSNGGPTTERGANGATKEHAS